MARKKYKVTWRSACANYKVFSFAFPKNWFYLTEIVKNSHIPVYSASFPLHNFTFQSQNRESIIEWNTNRFPVNSLAQPQFRKGTYFTSLFIDQSAVFALCRRHDVSTLPLTLINTSRALGTRLVPGFPEYCCAWVEKRDHRLKVLEPIFEEQIIIYNAKRLWVFPPNT